LAAGKVKYASESMIIQTIYVDYKCIFFLEDVRQGHLKSLDVRRNILGCLLQVAMKHISAWKKIVRRICK
jgi:hypothetical protein